MKLLLTSSGVANKSIETALREMLDKPSEQCAFVFVPTAANAAGGWNKTWLVNDIYRAHAMGWKSFDIVDIAAVSSLPREMWWPKFEQADVILVGGGNTFYLSYWLQKSGLFNALPELLQDKIYIGISAGSMIATKGLQVSSAALANDGVLKQEEFDDWGPKGQSDAKTMRLVEFYFRPHLNSAHFPNIREDKLREIAKKLDAPLYAADDESAVRVMGGRVEAISEGEWLLLGGQEG